MGYVYRVLWILKALWIVLAETINILKNVQWNDIFAKPKKILPIGLCT